MHEIKLMTISINFHKMKVIFIGYDEIITIKAQV